VQAGRCGGRNRCAVQRCGRAEGPSGCAGPAPSPAPAFPKSKTKAEEGEGQGEKRVEGHANLRAIVDAIRIAPRGEGKKGSKRWPL
jgi:hypothetical protein